MPSLHKGSAIRLFLGLLMFLPCTAVFADNVIVVSHEQSTVSIKSHYKEYIDKKGDAQPEEVLNSNFLNSVDNKIPVYSNSVKTVWIQFSAKNQTNFNTLYLDIRFSNLTNVKLYKITGSTVQLIGEGGNGFLNRKKVFKDIPNIIFDLKLKKEDEAKYLLKVYSEHPIILPAFVSTPGKLYNTSIVQSLINGLYFGLLLVMFLYNSFLFAATKDRNYIVYSVFVLCLILAQIAFSGYGFVYLWPNLPNFNYYAVVITSSISGIAATSFAIVFLHTKKHTPKWNKVLWFFIGGFVCAIIASLLQYNELAYNIFNYNSLILSFIALYVAILIAQKGERYAYFYIIAWSAFILSLIIVVLRNLNILPYNNFTAYVLYIGSGIETALLAIALADKINVLQQEKRLSQAAALKASQEKELLMSEQNVMLENKVAERTEELQQINTTLNSTLTNLKDTQIQLVEAEKMASLGQLTAGIAHEINNPINFVKSNITPLRLDVKDIFEVLEEYNKLHVNTDGKMEMHLRRIEQLKSDIDVEYLKKEIDELIKGIQDGAERTAEIVLGLRNFSRLDEAMIKTVNIHEGLESTLVLLRNNIPWYVKVKKNFAADGEIECLPSKLNQVFMNIINNAIQAINYKESPGENDFILLETRNADNNHIQIIIKDSGIGMNEDVKTKIFEPFFTTKDVGEGTGLGMSIVFKIIQRHNGTIEINSEPGQGSEFVITLPCVLPEVTVT